MQESISTSPPTQPVGQRKWPVLLAAGAAGLAATQAQGAVVYTPLNVTLDSAGVDGPTSLTVQMPAIGLSTDNTNAFQFKVSATNGFYLLKGTGGTGTILPTAILVDATSSLKALALPVGSLISNSGAAATPIASTSSTDSAAKRIVLDSADNVTAGHFTEAAGSEYIGFFINGTNYYAGWIQVQTTQTLADGNGKVEAQITGIALQNLISTPLAAGYVPEPTSLGLLAMGAVGLLGYRRRRPLA